MTAAKPAPPSRGANRPLVSVVVPVFNRPRFLAASLESVLAQTYRPIELIVVDDGSDEPLEGLVRQVAPQARYFWQPHGGVAAARNRGLDEARGELVAFQDSDDLWHPEKLAYQVALLDEQPQVGVVCTAQRVINADGHVIGGQWKPLYSGVVTEPLFADVFVIMPSTVVRREVVESVGRFDTALRINSDYQFWLRASLITEFGYIDRPLVDERRSATRLTNAKAEGMVLQYNMLKDFYERLGGSRRIRPSVAGRVLARSAFRAGRQLRREGKVGEAREMFRTSLAHRWAPRAWWGWKLTSGRLGREAGAAAPAGSSREALVAHLGRAAWSPEAQTPESR